MGQAKKRRACPALNREIPAAECGANRHVRYACPETCAFNPFAPANYAELLEIDGGVDLALMKRLHAADRMAITRLRAAEKENRGHGFHAAAVWHLHGKRDAEGLTVAERWAREGSGGGRNDEQLLLRGKLQMRIALLEVRRVLDAQRFEAIDLLEPDGAPRVFLDRSVGARAARFSTFLTWVYPLPHFWRMSGSGIGFDDVTPFPARETIAALVAHLGGPAELAAQRRWLAEHFVRIDEALAETGLERRRRMFAMMDTTWVAATYELRAPFDAARARLLGAPGVLDEEPSKEESAQGMLGAAVWLDDQPSVGRQFAQAGAGQPVAGRVLLGAKEWRVEGLGAKRVGRVRAAFEAWMGERVAFVRERRDDLNARMASDDPGPNVALVPPRLLERIMPLDVFSSRMALPAPGSSLRDHLANAEREYLRSWAETANPALEGLSPRETARDVARRPHLIELVKQQVRRVDKKNLQEGRSDDINFLIRELGLDEIDLPPPPPRARIGSRGGPTEADGGDEDDPEAAIELPPEPSPALRPAAPRLEGPAFDEEEAWRRLAETLKLHPTTEDADRELKASGATLYDDLQSLTRLVISPLDFPFLWLLGVQTWFMFVPAGVRAPSLDYQTMEAEFGAVIREILVLGKEQSLFDELCNGCRQPAIMDAVAFTVVQGAKQVEARRKLPPPVVPATLVAMKVLINELDRALRRA